MINASLPSVTDAPLDAAVDSPIHDALALVALRASDIAWRSLDLRAQIHWLGAADCPLDRRLIATTDIDAYKRWIGASDHDIRSGARQPTPQRPRWTVPPRRFLSGNELSAGDRLELRRAVASYVWGDSALVRGWRGAINLHAAPFELDVIAAGTIHLRDAAQLLIAERPTLLLVRHLVIEGGQLTMTVDGHIVVEALEKR